MSTFGRRSGGGVGGIDVLSDWAIDQMALIGAQVPAISNVRVIPGIGGLPFPTNVVTGGLQGGSWSASSGALGKMSTAILLTPSSTPFAFAFRAKFGAPTVARTSQLGLSNSVDTHVVNIGTDFGGSNTKFVIRVIGGATTFAASTQDADTDLHDFVVTSDAVNIKMFIDGVDSGATLAVSLIFGDEAYAPYIYNTTTLDARVVFGLVAW